MDWLGIDVGDLAVPPRVLFALHKVANAALMRCTHCEQHRAIVAFLAEQGAANAALQERFAVAHDEDEDVIERMAVSLAQGKEHSAVEWIPYVLKVWSSDPPESRSWDRLAELARVFWGWVEERQDVNPPETDDPELKKSWALTALLGVANSPRMLCERHHKQRRDILAFLSGHSVLNAALDLADDLIADKTPTERWGSAGDAYVLAVWLCVKALERHAAKAAENMGAKEVAKILKRASKAAGLLQRAVAGLAECLGVEFAPV